MQDQGPAVKCPRSLILILILFPFLPCALGVLPMRDQWRAACRALSTSQARQAQELFREFDSWYGDEPAAREAGFRSSYLRLRGLAAMQAGDPAEALPLFEEWLRDNPASAPFHAFIRFQAAAACRLLGRDPEALGHWNRFLEEHKGIPERLLVRWLKAELLAAMGQIHAAADEFRHIASDRSLPPSGAALAGAALALIEIERGEPATALAWLLQDEPCASPPLELWRSILAPAIAAGLLETSPADALRAAGWFDRPENMAFAAGLMSPARNGPGESVRQYIWNHHWEGQLERLRAAANPGTTSGLGLLHSLRLRALLRAGKPETALLLATVLMESEAEEARAVRPEACAGAIEAAIALKEWERARSVGQAFLEAFPADPELPRILFMLARLAAARADFNEAVHQANHLVSRFPEHSTVLSWRMAAAGWLLEGGQPATAMDALEDIATVAPPSWGSYLLLQRGRCLDKLGRPEEALDILRLVMDADKATPALREQALVEAIGISMQQFRTALFDQLLLTYRQRFPEGMNRLMVGNMAGSFHRIRGDLRGALSEFAEVASGTGEPARFAREQISGILVQLGDWPGLRRHALDWINNCLSSGEPLPPGPLDDCMAFLRCSGLPALPAEMLPALMERLATDPGAFPATALLDLLELQWDSLAPSLGAHQFRQWLDHEASAGQRSGQLLGSVRLRLHGATLLEREGRRDSADAIRIALLQVAATTRLDSASLANITFTADDYDFPESFQLLEALLDRSPAPEHRPEALLRLAQRLRKTGEIVRAGSLLREILLHWRDARVIEEAALLMAGWQLEEQRPAEALAVLDPLLERTSLDPLTAAKALLLRAQADFMAGNPERGRLSCSRIITLYPAFHDITEKAEALLQTPTDPEDSRV
jgi:tetratricopeptide (TPR) repeat protein